MEYKITKEECASRINGVCSMCGGQIEPLETVDNSNDTTFWSGCKKCSRLDNGVSEQTYLIAKELVEKNGYRHFSHIQDEPNDSEASLEYNKKAQISGACGLVMDVIRIYKNLTADSPE